MADTSAALTGSSEATLGFNGDLFDRQMRDLFAIAKEEDRAAKAGLGRMTLYRIRRHGIGNDHPAAVRLALTKATEIADLLGVTIDDLFPRRATVPQQRGAA